MLHLQGRTLALRPFDAEQIHDRYLAWLSDPVINAHSRRAAAAPVSEQDAKKYLEGLAPDEVVLGIHLPDIGHVGNVKFGPIDHDNSRADISILIGEASVWGRGVGKEAVYLVTRHLFEDRGLNRVDAGSSNPAFLKMVADLGWAVEGVLRQRVRFADGFRDHTLVAMLRDEFRRRPDLEPLQN